MEDVSYKYEQFRLFFGCDMGLYHLKGINLAAVHEPDIWLMSVIFLRVTRIDPRPQPKLNTIIVSKQYSTKQQYFASVIPAPELYMNIEHAWFK